MDLQNLSTPKTQILASIQLQKWLPQVVEPFQERSRQRQQRLSVEVEPELAYLICEPSSLGRIVAELLNNACKYTPAGEEIIVKAQTEAKTLHLSVSNSGVEISPSLLNRIFDKFYRIRSYDYWHQGGTGLGLALVQQLAIYMGGKISVASAGQQTQFTLELPLDGTSRNEELVASD